MASLREMTYGVSRQRVAAELAGAVLAVAGAFYILPLAALAAVLAILGVRDWWARPALTLEPGGLRYVVGLRREFAGWGLVESVRVRQERHFFAFGRNVEIDLSDDTLIVLSGSQLGYDPDEVAAAVERAWQEGVRSASTS